MKGKKNLKLILISPLICGWIFVTAYAQVIPVQKQQVKQLSTAERDNLFLQALSVFPEHKIPVEYRAILRPIATIKCATMLVAEVQQNYDLFTPEQQSVLRKLLSRPDLPLSYVSGSKRFKIHYAVSGPDSVSVDDLNNNQIPDYVEETALAFENTYRVEIEELGYLAPPDDVGEDGPEFDIYIAALRSGVYGLTTRETNFSFIQIDNDFNNGQLTHGIAGARVTAAHEYFHAVQFGYRNFLTNDEKFYYELCSTWIEDVVFDDINDYYFFLRPYFIYTNTPFNMFDTRGHYYGEAIWNHFLVKRLQDINVVRRTWEIMRSKNSLAIDAITEALLEKGTSFKNEFAVFAVWNYFTGQMRADSSNYYEEGAGYPEIRMTGDFSIAADTTIIDSSRALTTQYYKFTTFTSGRYSIIGTLERPAEWRFGAIVTEPGGSPAIHLFNLEDGEDFGFLPKFSEIVIIPVNVKILDGEDLPLLNFTYSAFSFNLKQGALLSNGEQAITAIYPNPLIIGQHDEINFKFTAIDAQEIVVRILNSNGKVVRSDRLTNGSGFLSRSSFIWNGTDDQNELVSSGVYILQLKQDDLIIFKKFAVIRE